MSFLSSLAVVALVAIPVAMVAVRAINRRTAVTVSAEAQKIVDRINELKASTHTQAEIDAAVAEAQTKAQEADLAQDTEDFNAINGALDGSPVANGPTVPATEQSELPDDDAA